QACPCLHPDVMLQILEGVAALGRRHLDPDSRIQTCLFADGCAERKECFGVWRSSTAYAKGRTHHPEATPCIPESAIARLRVRGNFVFPGKGHNDAEINIPILAQG